MENTYYISTNPEFYGSDATSNEAADFAEIIADKAREIFPNVQFVVIDGQKRDSFEDESLLAEVQQTINDKWVDWIA